MKRERAHFLPQINSCADLSTNPAKVDDVTGVENRDRILTRCNYRCYVIGSTSARYLIVFSVFRDATAVRNLPEKTG